MLTHPDQYIADAKAAAHYMHYSRGSLLPVSSLSYWLQKQILKQLVLSLKMVVLAPDYKAAFSNCGLGITAHKKLPPCVGHQTQSTSRANIIGTTLLHLQDQYRYVYTHTRLLACMHARTGACSVALGCACKVMEHEAKHQGRLVSWQVAEICVDALSEPAASNKVVEIVADQNEFARSAAELFSNVQ